jgi:hypothetical protein
MEAYRRLQVKLQAFYTSALDKAERSFSFSGCFTETRTCVHYKNLKHRVGPRSGMDMVVKRK